MKIYFLLEIVLLLAACLTAIIVTVKNVRLRKTIKNQQLSISDLRKINYDDMLKRVSLQLEKWKLKNNLLTVTAPLPERRENETDAHFNQRCRQTVANKCAKYVSVSEKLISITILR